LCSGSEGEPIFTGRCNEAILRLKGKHPIRATDAVQ
jgi:hypothetical protein